MKKSICFLLTICFVFIVLNFSYSREVVSEFLVEKSNVNILSVSEFASRLESEDVDIDDSDTYNICVLIQTDDALLSNDTTFNSSNISVNDKDVDVALKEHRDSVREYYSAQNEAIASSLDLEKYEYYVSYYSPYIEIVFDDLAEYEYYEEELLTSIVTADDVLNTSNYAIFERDNEETITDMILCDTNYLINDAFEDIEVLDSSFTGNGVNVGVIDSGIPDSLANLIDGKYTMIDFLPTNNHSTVITSIIGGVTGIAENVHFYCSTPGLSLIKRCNTLISIYNVNIINMSFNFGVVGYYTNYDGCIDSIISNTGCTIVKSAGNEGSSTDFVTIPGCALNAITVGSINFDQHISFFSSWNVSNDFLYKPDVVAPGERLWNIPNINNVDENGNPRNNGTSFAAPMVVGTIALLMEEFPILKTNPALVKSILHLGAEKLPTQTDHFDQQAGFGLLNYQNMRNCMLNLEYTAFTIPSTGTAGDTVLSYVIRIPYWNQININANSIINSSTVLASNSSTTPIYTNYTIKIYDFETSTHVASSTIVSSVDYLEFINKDPINSLFRIDIILESNNESEKIENGYIAYEIISHSPNHHYEQISTTQHKAYCECGEYEVQNHTYTEFVETSSTEHSMTCACGHTLSNQPHAPGVYEIYNNFKHYIYCNCGYFIGTSTHTMVTTGRYAVCTDCGVKIDTFSDVTIKVFEDENEISKE